MADRSPTYRQRILWRIAAARILEDPVGNIGFNGFANEFAGKLSMTIYCQSICINPVNNNTLANESYLSMKSCLSRNMQGWLTGVPKVILNATTLHIYRRVAQLHINLHIYSRRIGHCQRHEKVEKMEYFFYFIFFLCSTVSDFLMWQRCAIRTVHVPHLRASNPRGDEKSLVLGQSYLAVHQCAMWKPPYLRLF